MIEMAKTAKEKNRRTASLLENIKKSVKFPYVSSMSKVVSKLRTENPSIMESDIRQGVWRLIGRGELELTRDRKIALHKSSK